MASNPWFRMYHEFYRDPAVQMLAFEDQRHYVALLCMKCDGTLDKQFPLRELRDRVIAKGLGLDAESCKQVRGRLLEVGLIDKDWHPTGWHKRQFSDKGPTGFAAPGDARAYVYFIGEDGGEVVKVGYSKNPWARVKEFQTGHPSELRVLATVTTTENSEHHIAALLKGVRRRGEWYERSGLIDCLIKEIRGKRVASCKDVESYVATYGSTTTEEEAETEAETEKELKPSADALDNSPVGEPSPCPYSEVVKVYHETLPELRRVELLTERRKASIRARWRNEAPSLDEWRWLFERVKASPFLMGRVNGSNGRAPFMADFDWIVRPTNFVNIAEGKYAPTARR